MDVGQLLRATRKSAGLTQEELSPLVNISRSTISKVERNEMTLAAEDFIRWLQIVNIRMVNTAPLEAGLCLINGVDLFVLVDLLTKAVAGFISVLIGGN